MSVITRHWNAMTVALQAYRAYLSPASDVAGAFVARTRQYDHLWSLYENSIYERVGTADNWSVYKADYRLYPYTRALYNPVRRLVDFYCGTVYPGVLATDGEKLPEGVPLAIPLSVEQGNEALLGAVGQLWNWSNWQAGMRVMVRYAAALGSCLVEIVDEVEREKVCLAVHWPGKVTALELNPQGDVQAYTLEWDAEEKRDNGSVDRYRYSKEVDKEFIREWKGDVLTNEVEHRDEGSDHGAPAIAGSINKIDELNSLMSHIHRQIGRVIESPQVIATSGVLADAIDAGTRAGMSDYERQITLLRGPADTSTHALAGNLDLAAALPYAKELLAELERDHPELSMYSELRSMSSITGPAASRLLGDVQALVAEVSGNVDQQSIKCFGMAVAIAGERLKRGDWKGTRHQKAFAGFDLGSYERGDLEMEISPRALVPLTRLEVWQAEQVRAQALVTYTEALGSVEPAMPLLGFDEDQVAAITKERAEAIDREQRLAAEDVPPDVEQ
jgi:hypothetical protein